MATGGTMGTMRTGLVAFAGGMLLAACAGRDRIIAEAVEKAKAYTDAEIAKVRAER